MMQEPQIVSVEGNIGAGKSTLVAALGSLEGVFVVEEPVAAWAKVMDGNGTPMLDLFYKDTEKHAFAFQVMAFMSRLDALRRLRDSPEVRACERPILVTERCLQTDRHVFTEMLRDSNMMCEEHHAVYRMMYDNFARECPVHALIHLDLAPEACMDRIRERGRSGEEGVGANYLASLDAYTGRFVEAMECEGGKHVIAMAGKSKADVVAEATAILSSIS
jgi:deoxyadenosine/deoxycytidine kinase